MQIHARGETVPGTPMFAGAFLRRRALIPVDRYWQRNTVEVVNSGRRFEISRLDGKPMAWAGLWESFVWPGNEIERTYCVLTVEANELISPIHDRMPLILEESDWPLWLGEVAGDPADLIRTPRADLLQRKLVRR